MRRRLILSLLVLVFVYTGFSKLFGWDYFSDAMHNQPLPHWLSNTLIWSLPPLELCTALGLAFTGTQRIGLISSFILLLIFTIYTGAIMLHFFPRVPCSCGGIFRKLGWHAHFWINVGLTLLAALELFKPVLPRTRSSIPSPINSPS